MTDLDGNVKIGGLFWCDKGETTPLQLLPLTNHLMYPWLYSEPVEADVTKWRKDSAAIEFWQTIAKPKTSMAQLSDSPLLKLPWTTNDVRELVMLAFDHKRTEAMMKHDPPLIRRLPYPMTIDNAD
ncbi:uncharacterized protein BBA_09332 [Beauveria bassiana ARSEF 2860]|uniref:Uncharacterized protein n=1 Tax=Beauveria bassiana (strain ARSEF 2860) TaxID=655819 RepID=J5JCX8_BEAB2|nr:uncharacterized protein BBA_09332 [Beauveria bassiana ARSEF 2860]EJP61691.1 hypothetical protein BBA_09332 [Beauveria bassiana ARSEF 2860]